jgi:hypothetical protein
VVTLNPNLKDPECTKHGAQYTFTIGKKDQGTKIEDMKEWNGILNAPSSLESDPLIA